MDALFRSKRKNVGSPAEPRPSRDDPLSEALKPSPDESEAERTTRLEAIQEAIRVSRKIDSEISESRKAMEKRKKAIKILLLGQSESGKSTVLKNFQMTFAPKQFQNERAAWRTIIQLNLIGSIKKVLEVLQYEWDPDHAGTAKPASPDSLTLTDKHRRLRMGLSPLLSIETSLNQLISPVNYNSKAGPGICVQAGSDWKAMLNMVTPDDDPSNVSNSNPRRNGRPGSRVKSNDPTIVLAACKGDIIDLWEDPVVQAVLKRHGVRLAATSGFFLNDTERVARVDYSPTDDDIVRARVRTMGVEEHHFIMETTDFGTEYIIYDVGGGKRTRPLWIPYFEDVQSILFLAPLAFDQYLEEEPDVNRLEDSVSIWREICSNRLLARATIILFLNKMDILEATLADGVLVNKYVPSYGDAPNDLHHVTKYFKDKFRAYHKQLSPLPRPFMCHKTSAIDTAATTVLLGGVREAILRINLQKINAI